MPLSRKYYIKFADLFAEHNRGVSAEFRKDFENLLKTDNPRFNRERFADHITKNSREQTELVNHKARTVSTVRAFLRPEALKSDGFGVVKKINNKATSQPPVNPPNNF